MTLPADITDTTYLDIWKKLQALNYPCTIVVYGPERTHRSRYRAEHGPEFALSYCNTPEEAWAVIDCGYVGYPPDLRVYSIPGEPEELNR